VQSTTEVHHQIADALLPQAEPVFADATALHTAVPMLDPPPAVGERLIGHALLQRSLLAAWCLGRHQDLDLGECARQEAQLLPQSTPGRSGIRSSRREALIVHTPCISCAEAEHRAGGMDSQDMFDRMVLFLAALTCGLLRRVLGADDAPFRPVMGNRGDAGAAAGTATRGAGSSSGTTTVAASAAEPPSRWARAVRERAGASPMVRSAASSAGKRT
jgi:hypothetical protein